MTLASPDDGGLRASVLSRWDDGSAAVVVVAGSTTLSGTADQVLRLQLGQPIAAEPSLTAARIAALVSSVKVDLGALGVINLTSFTSPERVWWSNPQTICARYRVAAPQHPTLEAVIDIQAFARNQALVEVVVENAKLNPALPVKPADANYSAVVTINGTSVAVVRSNGGPEATHASFRAWYASMTIGASPGVRAMQAVADSAEAPVAVQDGPGQQRRHGHVCQ